MSVGGTQSAWEDPEFTPEERLAMAIIGQAIKDRSDRDMQIEFNAVLFLRSEYAVSLAQQLPPAQQLSENQIGDLLSRLV